MTHHTHNINHIFRRHKVCTTCYYKRVRGCVQYANPTMDEKFITRCNLEALLPFQKTQLILSVPLVESLFSCLAARRGDVAIISAHHLRSVAVTDASLRSNRLLCHAQANPKLKTAFALMFPLQHKSRLFPHNSQHNDWILYIALCLEHTFPHIQIVDPHPSLRERIYKPDGTTPINFLDTSSDYFRPLTDILVYCDEIRLLRQGKYASISPRPLYITRSEGKLIETHEADISYRAWVNVVPPVLPDVPPRVCGGALHILTYFVSRFVSRFTTRRCSSVVERFSRAFLQSISIEHRLKCLRVLFLRECLPMRASVHTNSQQLHDQMKSVQWYLYPGHTRDAITKRAKARWASILRDPASSNNKRPRRSTAQTNKNKNTPTPTSYNAAQQLFATLPTRPSPALRRELQVMCRAEATREAFACDLIICGSFFIALANVLRQFDVDKIDCDLGDICNASSAGIDRERAFFRRLSHLVPHQFDDWKDCEATKALGVALEQNWNGFRYSNSNYGRSFESNICYFVACVFSSEFAISFQVTTGGVTRLVDSKSIVNCTMGRQEWPLLSSGQHVKQTGAPSLHLGYQQKVRSEVEVELLSVASADTINLFQRNPNSTTWCSLNSLSSLRSTSSSPPRRPLKRLRRETDTPPPTTTTTPTIGEAKWYVQE